MQKFIRIIYLTSFSALPNSLGSGLSSIDFAEAYTSYSTLLNSTFMRLLVNVVIINHPNYF